MRNANHTRSTHFALVEENASDVTSVTEGQQVETQDTETTEGQRHYYTPELSWTKTKPYNPFNSAKRH